MRSRIRPEFPKGIQPPSQKATDGIGQQITSVHLPARDKHLVKFIACPVKETKQNNKKKNFTFW